MPPLESFIISTLGIVMINVYVKFEIPIYIHYGNIKECQMYKK